MTARRGRRRGVDHRRAVQVLVGVSMPPMTAEAAEAAEAMIVMPVLGSNGGSGADARRGRRTRQLRRYSSQATTRPRFCRSHRSGSAHEYFEDDFHKMAGVASLRAGSVDVAVALARVLSRPRAGGWCSTGRRPCRARAAARLLACDLEHRDAGAREPARDAGAVAARALDLPPLETRSSLTEG
jgi:hypothetical protein